MPLKSPSFLCNLAGLAELGIDLGAVTWQLEIEGVQKFTEAFIAWPENLRQRLSRDGNSSGVRQALNTNDEWLHS